MSADNFQPNLTLREEPLKRALKSYLVAPILSKYIVCSVRVLWRESDNDLNDLYEKRRKLEGELERLKEVSLFIDCITAMKKSNGGIKIGFAFWVAFDFAESQGSKLEDYITKRFFESGLDVAEVNCIRGRSK